MLNWIFLALISESILIVASVLFSNILSVISSLRKLPSKPVSAITRSIRSISFASLICWLARLTLIFKFAARGNFSCHSRICWQAWCITHSPIGTIKPISSAIEINSWGETKPRSGCCQRINASKPTNLPVTKETIGW